MAFNPGLNRVSIGHFPGLSPGLAGRLAHEWLATWSLAPRMHTQLDCTELPAIPDMSKLGQERPETPAQRGDGWKVTKTGGVGHGA